MARMPSGRLASRRSARRVVAWFGCRPTSWSTVVPIIAGLAGLIFATSFTTAQGTELRSVGRDLPDQIRGINRTVAAKAEEVRRLQGDVDRLAVAAAPGSTRIRDLTTTSEALAPLAGTRGVRGPLVRVSLDDAHRSADSLPPPYGPDDVVVHQQDVQGVVNALWAGGAEAMMIQDQRVISTSAVRCVGNTLLLQGRVYSPPYVITAIGDPAALTASLGRDRQVQIYREWVDAVGLGYDVSVPGDGEFPAYSGPVEQQDATVSR